MIRALLLVAMFAAGCAAAPRDPFALPPSAGPAWPAPPEARRVAYISSIRRHQDLFEEGGFWSAIASAVGGPRDSALVRPYALAIHPAGGLLATDPGARCVHFFHWARGRYVRLGEGIEGGLPSPVGVAVAADGSILVSDSRLGRIERFSPGGERLAPFATDSGMRRPAGIAADPASGNVAVVDVLSHAVLLLAGDGTLRGRIGRQGSAPGEFNFPSHVAFAPDGSLLVADSMNFRIQRLAADGTPLGTFGRAGDAAGDFAQPKGVAAIGPGTFAAVEGRFDAVVFWNAAGQLLLSIGRAGSEPGEFWLPSGLAFDPARRLLFVADSYNSRIQVFRIEPDPAPEAAP